MSYQPVNVVIKDQNQDPIPGVIVRVFNPAGTVVFTQQTTDTNGQASFLLFTQDYSMRFYLFSATFPQPQMFTVEESPAVNTFDVVGEVFVPPISNDQRLCRCSGYFRDIDGTPQEYLDLQFFADFDPVLLDRAGIIPRSVHGRTDGNGYFQIDLIRCAKYRVSIEAMECADRFIRVPELASANLPDILFPVLKSVTLTPPGPYNLTVGSEVVVTPFLLDSAGVPLKGTGDGDVTWRMSDTNIASIVVGATTVTIRGNAAGTTQLNVERTDYSIIGIPAPTVSGQPITITVT